MRTVRVTLTALALATLTACSAGGGGGPLPGETDTTTEYSRSISATRAAVESIAKDVSKQDLADSPINLDSDTYSYGRDYQYGATTAHSSQKFCVWLIDPATGVSVTYQASTHKVTRNNDGTMSCSPTG